MHSNRAVVPSPIRPTGRSTNYSGGTLPPLRGCIVGPSTTDRCSPTAAQTDRLAVKQTRALPCVCQRAEGHEEGLEGKVLAATFRVRAAAIAANAGEGRARVAKIEERPQERNPALPLPPPSPVLDPTSRKEQLYDDAAS